ncbi:HNH endonuclease [Pseudomonas aeruginosa]|nr:HNH endonuclease [Pseudomonas aeruginosa]
MIGGKRKRERVHRLVAILFHGPRPTPFHQVCHVDGDKLNNSSNNLYWGDARENAADRKRHGRTSSGAKHSSSIIAGQAASKLAAAAPELLEALQVCIEQITALCSADDVPDQARAAIAKATA